MASPILFNPSGDDSTLNRCVWGGSPTNLIELNNVRYKWATNLYQQMRNQFWQPQKVDLSEDKNQYQQLTNAEKIAYKANISFLTFLDSLQTVNLPHLQTQITAPEIRICLTEHGAQEAMHNQSYQFLIESVLPVNEQDQTYYWWRQDEHLLSRVEAITSWFAPYVADNTERGLIKSLVGTYFLEGVLFHTGFMFFYNLGMRGLMRGTTDMIKLIHRDEITHVKLFQELLAIAATLFDRQFLEETIVNMAQDVFIQETAWADYLYGNAILGISNQSTQDYLRYLIYHRIKALNLGLEKYVHTTAAIVNPYKHLDKLADVGTEGTTKENFFESTVSKYLMSSAVAGWDLL